MEVSVYLFLYLLGIATRTIFELATMGKQWDEYEEEEAAERVKFKGSCKLYNLKTGEVTDLGASRGR